MASPLCSSTDSQHESDQSSGDIRRGFRGGGVKESIGIELVEIIELYAYGEYEYGEYGCDDQFSEIVLLCNFGYHELSILRTLFGVLIFKDGYCSKL